MSMSRLARCVKPSCEHRKLILDSSAHSVDVGYTRAPLERRVAAMTPSGRVKPRSESGGHEDPAEALLHVGVQNEHHFPAPLLFPGDDLSLDPSYPAQSFRSWTNEKDRNKVLPRRKTIYIAHPPQFDSGSRMFESWVKPKSSKAGVGNSQPRIPDIRDVAEYIEAFYHPLPVKVLPSDQLTLTEWEDESSNSEFLGLVTDKEKIRVRTRKGPGGLFHRQLHLDDLLDVAIGILPSDAYALIMLVNHDLYEEDDEEEMKIEFVCGRAYGGSRVAVVSTARYNPDFDVLETIDRGHSWPASHCETYVQFCAGEQNDGNLLRPKKSSSKKASSQNQAGNSKRNPINLDDSDHSSDVEITSPMHLAVSALSGLEPPDAKPTLALLEGMWLGRVCRTAAHELGHCFGIDHCVYYACTMQGSASLVEDSRQPPYLCPIDLVKVLKATGASAESHYKAMLAFCDQRKAIHLFAAYAAWIRARLDSV